MLDTTTILFSVLLKNSSFLTRVFIFMNTRSSRFPITILEYAYFDIDMKCIIIGRVSNNKWSRTPFYYTKKNLTPKKHN